MLRSHVEEFSPALAHGGPQRERTLSAFRSRLIKRQLWAALFSEVDRGGGLGLPTLIAAIADAATVDMGLTFVVAVHNACLSGFFARATTSTTVPEHMPAAVEGERLLYWLDGSKGNRLTAQKQPRGWNLRGGFDELPGAAMAGVFLAVGVTGETPALLVVPASAPGVSVQTTVGPGDPSGIAASIGLASVTFNDVILPDEALLIGLGERANGVVHFELLDILGAAIGIGVASATLGSGDTRPGVLMTELEKLGAGYDRRRKTNQLAAARAVRADAFALARNALTERHGSLLRAGDRDTARLSDDATLMTLTAIDRALG